MKKLNVLWFVMAGCLTLFGCSNSNSQTEHSTDIRETSAKESIKIAIVSSPSGVDDGSFNQDIYQGIQSFIKENPASLVTPVQESTGDTSAAIGAVADIVSDYEVIVCCGFQFSGIGTIALDNPKTDFILVDAAPTDEEGNEVEADNIYAMTFAEQESGFFAGACAALQTKSNKVAVVNGIAYPSNINYQYGFEAGVHYANKHYQTNAEYISLSSYAGRDWQNKDVGGNYIGSFADEATGKVVGNALIQEGCDIIFAAAGASGNGVFTAAKEAGNVQVIGCDVDQYEDGANQQGNIVLTSALKLMGANVKKQLEAIRSGSFKGGNALLKADTDSTGYVKEKGRHQLSEDTIKKLDEIYEAVRSRQVVPPSATNEMSPEEFTGL